MNHLLSVFYYREDTFFICEVLNQWYQPAYGSYANPQLCAGQRATKFAKVRVGSRYGTDASDTVGLPVGRPKLL